MPYSGQEKPGRAGLLAVDPLKQKAGTSRSTPGFNITAARPMPGTPASIQALMAGGEGQAVVDGLRETERSSIAFGDAACAQPALVFKGTLVVASLRSSA